MISSSDILHGKILIVDDQEINILLLERMLRGAGYVSTTSTMNPGEVCALHLKNRYDLILLDLQMPDMDGFQVMEALKEIEPDSYLPVLVITAQPGHKLRALQSGAKDFISKPFDLSEVLARVHNLLEVRLLHKELHDYNETLEQRVRERNANLQESEEKFRRLVEGLPSVVYMTSVDDASTTLYVSPQITAQMGYTPQEWLADPGLLSKTLHPEDRQNILMEIADTGRRNKPFNREYRRIARDGRLVWVHDQSLLVNDLEGKPKFRQGIMLDISARKHAEERIRRQLEHLTALSTIDRVIASNFDLKLNLSEILTHVRMELGIDAADILILNPGSQMLEYGAERGFRTKAVRKRQVRLGQSYAGRAALERQIVEIPNLRDEPDYSLLTPLLADDDFVCYYGVPLITKGQVKGVLEVFHRSALEPDLEWFDFLHTLAGQAAIAIENAMLFESLQRSNLELALAYDATIEGWSHALDLRDKETEGHTQRVAEMTMKLARAFGLSDAELIQVRWGALLHDIGKMGVPDGILLKPGPLTDAEWVAMKKHPAFAYEMLAPVRYLRLALDIPYSHHEKWDGTGYPRGLKGNQIPLVARIFAVVDVWDALISDRPYRSAWAKEKVREYMRTSAGTHFDPQVVDVFMQMIN
jgi:PAS domain S-box-containing protein/putative nucleotidyltransferase with HDIG domain